MIKHTYILALFGAAILTAGAAQAGSLKDEGPAPSACSGGPFAGHYFGANIGYISHDSELSAEGESLGYDDSGVVGGIHYGYNVQCGRFVVGMESDFSLTSTDPRVNEGPAFVETDVEWISTSRLRIGLAHDNVLFYATGGLATADIEQTIGLGSLSFSDDDVEWGWTAGGGIEMMRQGGWSVRAEALYVDFGETSRTFTDGVDSTSADFSDDMWIARVGLSYQYDLGAILGRASH